MSPISIDPTCHLLAYDLAEDLPPSDIELGLTGIFRVFGNLRSVVAIPGGGQAVATFESVGEAKAALARLQNFPIWGRQISLAYARDAPAPAASHFDHRTKRPSTAPRKSAAPGFSGTARASPSGAAAVKRDLWASPQRGSAADSPKMSPTKQPGGGSALAPPRGTAAAAVARVSPGNKSSPSARVASAAGGSGKPSPATHPSGAARVAGAQGGVAAQGRGGVAREAWGERGAGEEPSFSALSDVEAGSELQVGTSRSASDRFEEDSSEEEEEDESYGGSSTTNSNVGLGQQLARVVPVDDVEDEDYGDNDQDIGEELGGLIEMLSADSPMVENISQLQEMLKVAKYMKELDSLMKTLTSMQEQTEAGAAMEEALERGGTPERGAMMDVGEAALHSAQARLRAAQEQLAALPPGFIDSVRHLPSSGGGGFGGGGGSFGGG
ncbi:hypothetical protein T484DRAFT_2025956, partial [Baffinella frigidus]